MGANLRQRKAPAFDPLVLSEQGASIDGQPLSYNRAPAPDLVPWIGRLYASKVSLPEDYTLSCSQLNDVAGLRIQLAGLWEAETADGREVAGVSARLFGPQSRRMPIRVTGSFISVGTAIRPGACMVIDGLRISDILDRAVSTEVFGSPEAEIVALFDPEASAEEWILALENYLRGIIEMAGSPLPDPVTARFEQIAYSSPSMTVAEAARSCGIDRRRLERIVQRDFGMTPKQVLRRARALDMASHLRGVADEAEAEDIILRYYDESHLIREFMELFGMSPGQFVATPQPLLTLSLESRQARRLEDLDRIPPGGKRPWQPAAA